MDWQIIFNFLVMVQFTFLAAMFSDLTKQIKQLEKQVEGIIAVMQEED